MPQPGLGVLNRLALKCMKAWALEIFSSLKKWRHQHLRPPGEDAVRILLTRTANEGALPLELVSHSEAYPAWFRTKVLQALEDTRPDVDDADADAHFRERRAAALHKAVAGDR